ncbi:hypothetical protein LAY41_11165 [Argonema galeatum A003/A1]|nr:hypothetical protein [Argonema galeatum A003/A1]
MRYRQPVGAGLADNFWFSDKNNGKTRPYERAIKELISLYFTRLQAAVNKLNSQKPGFSKKPGF